MGLVAGVCKEICVSGKRKLSFWKSQLHLQHQSHPESPSIGSDVFTGATNGTIYYVQGTAGWSSYYGGLPTAKWVPPLPSISVQPISVTVIAESPATLSVSATGMEPLSYQWSKEGVTIVGGTNANFSITATTESDPDVAAPVDRVG